MTPTSIADLSAALHPLLTTVPLNLARACGFTRRARRLTADVFCQCLVFGWLARPDASLEHFARASAEVGAGVSAQAWHQRFGPGAAQLLRGVLEAAVQLVVCGEPATLDLLARFVAVVLVDSSSIGLPAVFADLWPGCGGGRKAADGAACLKVSVAFDLLCGRLWGFTLASGRTHDRAAAPVMDLPRGSLVIRDRGYFAFAALRAFGARGVHFLTRPQSNVVAYYRGERFTLADLLKHQRRRAGEGPLDVDVELGGAAQLPVRLLAWPVPPPVYASRCAALRREAHRRKQPLSDDALTLAGYQLLVTDLSPDQLSAREAQVLYRARWQIELLFKLWKSTAGLADSRSANPERILCEVYAKLLAVLLAHWCLLVSGLWGDPRRSLVKGLQHLQCFAVPLLAAFARPARFRACLADLARGLQAGCRLNPRRARTNTCQLLLGVAWETLS
jgi:Transposase DDE domain